MKSTIKYLSITLIISLFPILILLSSYQERLSKLAGDFKREIRYKVSKTIAFDLKYNSYYVAGSAGDYMFLGNHSTKPRLLRISKLLKDTATIGVTVNDELEAKNANYRIILDSLNFYLLYGLEHRVLIGRTGLWQATRHDIDPPFFQQGLPISNSSVAFRYISSQKKQNSLIKISTNGSKIENDKVLEKQVDGRFCTSGNLEYNKKLNVLTYLYAYRNQILVLDTNLNLLKKIKTIDHIDTARFEVSTINSSRQKVITKPTILVNPKCATYKQYLLVHSKIMGNEEDDTQFEHSTAIDIYDIQNGTYVYSFYLPNPNKVNISEIKIIDGYVYTLSQHYISRYTIQLPE